MKILKFRLENIRYAIRLTYGLSCETTAIIVTQRSCQSVFIYVHICLVARNVIRHWNEQILMFESTLKKLKIHLAFFLSEMRNLRKRGMKIREEDWNVANFNGVLLNFLHFIDVFFYFFKCEKQEKRITFLILFSINISN